MRGLQIPFRILAGAVHMLPVLHLISTIDKELTDDGKTILHDWRTVLVVCFGISYTATGGDRFASLAASAIVVGIAYEIVETRPELLGKYFTRYKDRTDDE